MLRPSILVVIAALMASSSAIAQEEPLPDPPAAALPATPGLKDLMHARNYAMGGAYRAHGLGAEAASGNPAAIGMFKRYQLELSGAWDIQSKFAFATVAVADSVTSEVAAGVSYHLVTMDGGQTLAHLNTASFSFPISQMIHVGAAGRHVLMTGAREA